MARTLNQTERDALSAMVARTSVPVVSAELLAIATTSPIHLMANGGGTKCGSLGVRTNTFDLATCPKCINQVKKA